MLGRMVRSFVELNRRLSNSVQKGAPGFFDRGDYKGDLRTLIQEDALARQVRTIVEVGGIDRPMLEKNGDFRYVGVDIEDKDDCYEIYDEFIVQSVEKPLPIQADTVISRVLMEHVPDNRAAVRSMYAALRPGGKTFHYVPSKWHPYSIALRIVGATWQRRLIPLLRPGAERTTGYPAFFDHCSPRAMRKLFRNTGFEDIEIRPYYKASDYFAFFFPAFVLVAAFEFLSKKLGWSIFSSGFIISAAVPEGDGKA